MKHEIVLAAHRCYMFITMDRYRWFTPMKGGREGGGGEMGEGRGRGSEVWSDGKRRDLLISSDVTSCPCYLGHFSLDPCMGHNA